MLWNTLKQHLANEGHQRLRQTPNEESKQRVKPVARESDNGNDFLKYTEQSNKAQKLPLEAAGERCPRRSECEK